jgi:triosephosphate isomerase
MRKPMIAGNWKLHKTIAEATRLVSELIPAVASNQNVDIVVAPVYTALPKVAETLAGSNIKLAAQNCYPEPQGAFTGEVSPLLLKDAGCEYVIIGHSERRQLFAETDAGKMFDVLRQQVTAGLQDLTTEQMKAVVVAYEPVWAIGTGKVATDEQAQEVHAFIRGLLAELYDAQTAAATRILYGGSVKPGNVDGLMTQPDVDGALVGGASLKAEDFARIANFEPVA